MYTQTKAENDIYFFFIKERLMKPKEAIKAANVNYNIALKRKRILYGQNPPKKKIRPEKKKKKNKPNIK